MEFLDVNSLPFMISFTGGLLGHSSGYFKFQKHEDKISSLMRKMLEQPSLLQCHTLGGQS